MSGRRQPLNLENAAAVANITLQSEICPETLVTFFADNLPMLHSILSQEIPRVESKNVIQFVDGEGKTADMETGATFYCLKFETSDQMPVYLTPASLDYQGLKDDRTYIVAGGTRGIGLKTVQWMAARGAKVILVIGVSRISHSTQLAFDELKSKFQTRVFHVRANIAAEEDMNAIDETLDELPPVAGVVNSAGVLDDKEFHKIDRSSYQKVMRPKVNGTINLQSLVDRRQQELDFFLLYSSIASILGNQGQSSYSAANDFLNSFAEYRRHFCKKPCLSICWGAMGGAGMLDRNRSLATVLENVGLFMLNIDQGINWMEEILLANPPETCLCICDIDWERYLRTVSDSRSLFEFMRLEVGNSLHSDGDDVLTILRKASSREDQEHVLLKFIKRILVSFTGGIEEEIDCFVPLVNYGVDSVGASLFKSRVLQDLNIDLEVFFFILPETTPTVLTNVLLDRLYESSKMTFEPSEKLQLQKEENGFLHRRNVAGKRFYSFRTIAPQCTNDDDRVTLPDNYLTAIYDPPDAIAKIFVVHPSHRYAGVFQAIASGMKYQDLFSLYAFGHQDPACIGENYRTVRLLAEACTELLLRKEPSGPYFLAGYSFGGILAIEIATILQNTGRNVALLSMIDTNRWIPESACNSKSLSDLSSYSLEHGIIEQIKGFFERIALTQLKITKEKYNDDTRSLSIHEIADYLTSKANQIEKEISDTRGSLQSILDDYEMAISATLAWHPPENMYKGQVVYIQAENCLCQTTNATSRRAKCSCSFAIGTPFECWSSLLAGDTFLATCSGDHFSMVEKARGQDIGNVLATSASLAFRKYSPLTGGIKLNALHATAKEICKARGVKVCMIRESVLRKRVVIGFILYDDSCKQIIFHGKGFLYDQMKINLGDVVFIRKLNIMSLQRMLRFSFTNQDLHSGYVFQLLKQEVAFVFLNKQDFKNFGYLLEAIYRIKLHA